MKINVASPCKKDWAKMSGDDKVRACAECKLNVYNLSAMTQAEVVELVKQREGRMCVRFFMRHDGTVITRDCPIGISRKRRAYAASIGAAATLFSVPMITAGAGGGQPAFLQQVRALVFELKLKLGLERPVVMMGDLAP